MRYSYTYNNIPTNGNFLFSPERTIEKNRKFVFTYVKSNHLGNVLVTISDRKLAVDANTDGTTDYYVADVLSSQDYYAFGMLMPGRVFNPGTSEYGYNGQRTTDEIAGVGNHYTAEFWEYDPRAVLRWNMDPEFKQFAGESPYVINHNNPIRYSDPKGNIPGEYEKNKEGKFEKVSTKGDEIGVDFYHSDQKKLVNGKLKDVQVTYINDRQGNWNTMTNGRKALSGTVRSNDVDWRLITTEWQEGVGPEKSLFVGDHPANKAIQDNYLFENAFQSFYRSGQKKDGKEINFIYILDNIRTGANGQVQMMGSYNLSFYKLGDRTLNLVQDSKSRSSFYYHLPVENFERGTKKSDRDANTYQSYLFFR